MKVLHLAAGSSYGGVERALVAYGAGRLACPDMEPYFGVAFEGQVVDELRAEGLHVEVLGPARLSRRASVREGRERLKESLRVLRPDVVVTHGLWAHCLYAPVVQQVLRAPVALFLHGVASLNTISLLARLTPPALVLEFSQYSIEQNRWWIRSLPVAVLRYPLPRRVHPDRAQARARFGLRPESVVVLQASRLEPGKGHKLHLKALARLRDDPTWLAWFAGASQKGQESYEAELRDLRDKLGLTARVQFLGHRTDLDSLLAATDILCQPNLSPESFGIIFLEAMQAALPVITTKMGGGSEILSGGGGTLVPPDPENLARALGEMIKDDPRRLSSGRIGREIVGQLHSTDLGMRDLAAHLADLRSGAKFYAKGRAWV